MTNGDFIKLDAYHRRERILDAAAELFAEKGFDAVTTMELSAAAGCRETLLLNMFRTKNEIYNTLFEEWKVQTQKPAPIKIMNNSAIDTLRNFYNKQTAKMFARSPTMRPNLESALFSRLTDSSRVKMVGVLRSAPDFVSTVIQPVIEFGQSNGEIVNGDSAELACIFWGIIWGEKIQKADLKRQTLPFTAIQYIFSK